MLSLEAPAKRSRVTVGNWFKGMIIDRKKTEEKERDIIPIDLVSLNPPSDYDLVSKKTAQKLANSPWTYRLFKVSCWKQRSRYS